jgi:hypothetical protein
MSIALAPQACNRALAYCKNEVLVGLADLECRLPVINQKDLPLPRERKPREEHKGRCQEHHEGLHLPEQEHAVTVMTLLQSEVAV